MPNSESKPAIEVPVLVVGGGAVGLVAALLLARRGVACLVAEKYDARLEAPKAHALNPRSLEICRAAGLSIERIRERATPRDQGALVRFVSTMVGEEYGTLPYERQDDAALALTPTPLVNVAQPRFEAIVEEEVRRAPGTTIARGLEWLGSEDHGDRVVSTLRERASGRTRTVTSRFVIAADGAASSVRGALGIAMEGLESLRHHMMIHFEADLRPLTASRPAVLYFLLDPRAEGVLISYDAADTWVLMHPYDPEAADQTFDEETCRRIVVAALGSDVCNVAVRSARPWSLSAQVAERYRAGNVFLAGDAAHRFPPTGGLGLNTGIADADNLTWRMAAVLAGGAGAGTLDAYEVERRSVARANRDQSLANAMRLAEVPIAMAEVGLAGAPPALPLAADEARARVAAAIADQKDHFDSLRLQLGYVYGLDHDDHAALSIADFRPRAIAGARLPHAWIRLGGKIASTLDLVPVDGFALLCAGGSVAWQRLASTAPATIARRVAGRDFELAGTSWRDLYGTAETGALLVRPDGHILARAEDDSAAGVAAVQAALERCLDVEALPCAASGGR